MEKRIKPLMCEVRDGELIVSIGVDTLAVVAKFHPHYYDGNFNLVVTDPDVFAKEVAHSLSNCEGGILKSIDAAIVDAVESGCDGVECTRVDHDWSIN